MGVAEAIADSLLGLYGRKQVADVLSKIVTWPEQYVNAETGKVYKPHHERERLFVFNDTPRYGLIKGGEGSGKSSASVIKNLERLRRGMSGIMFSPDLEHFKKSLWEEFKRWCPWQCVIDRHRYYQQPGWIPSRTFNIVFHNERGGYSTLWCGGAKESEIESWQGPNVSFAHGDEIARHKTAAALKTLAGRTRIPGPNGEPPQVFISTTPKKHWLFEYFGPLLCHCTHCDEDVEVDVLQGAVFQCPLCERSDLEVIDEKAPFKRSAITVTLKTQDNVDAGNLDQDYVDERRAPLTEAEARVYLGAEWEDLAEAIAFLPSMTFWDACQEKLPPLDMYEPIVLALDGAVGRESGSSDCFSIIGVSRHPDPKRRKTSVALRFAFSWQAKAGQEIDFRGTELNPGPERMLYHLTGRRLLDTGAVTKRDRAKGFHVVCICYDPTELHDMAQRFRALNMPWMYAFGQNEERIQADTDFRRLIMERRFAHQGEREVRQHVDNANRKTDGRGKRMRIVKRTETLKVDLAVAAAMACHRCLSMNMTRHHS